MNYNENYSANERPQEFASLKTDLHNLEVVSMEGAGVTGVIYTGALTALHEEGLLDKVKCFAGTSSGSIVATGAALGYRGKELETLALKQNFKAFCRTNHRWWSRRKENFARDGIFSGGEMNRWISNLCAKRIGKASLTFEDLKEYKAQADAENYEFFDKRHDEAMKARAEFRKGMLDKYARYDFEMPTRDQSIKKMMEIAGSFRSLEVAATEITDDVWLGKKSEKAAIFNEKTTPKRRISRAVRASASYPFYFRHAHINDEHGKGTYTDGGFTTIIPTPLRDENGEIGSGFLGLSSEFIEPTKSPKEVTLQKAGTQEDGFLESIKASLSLQKRIKHAVAKVFGHKVLSYLEDETYCSADTKHKNKLALKRGLDRMAKDIHRFTVMVDLMKGDEEITSHTIPLNRKGILGTHFDITDEEKQSLIDSAYQTMQDNIAKFRENNGLIGGVKPMNGRFKGIDAGDSFAPGK